MIENKIHQFNESLLKNGSVELDSDSSDSETDNDAESVTTNEPNDSSAQQYYTSPVWGQKVDIILAAIGNIDQPMYTPMYNPPMLTPSQIPQPSKHTPLFSSYLSILSSLTELQAGTSHHNIRSQL